MTAKQNKIEQQQNTNGQDFMAAVTSFLKYGIAGLIVADMVYSIFLTNALKSLAEKSHSEGLLLKWMIVLVFVSLLFLPCLWLVLLTVERNAGKYTALINRHKRKRLGDNGRQINN